MQLRSLLTGKRKADDPPPEGQVTTIVRTVRQYHDGHHSEELRNELQEKVAENSDIHERYQGVLQSMEDERKVRLSKNAI